MLLHEANIPAVQYATTYLQYVSINKTPQMSLLALPVLLHLLWTILLEDCGAGAQLPVT